MALDWGVFHSKFYFQFEPIRNKSKLEGVDDLDDCKYGRLSRKNIFTD